MWIYGNVPLWTCVVSNEYVVAAVALAVADLTIRK